MSWTRFLALVSGLEDPSLVFTRLESQDWRSRLRRRLGLSEPTRVMTWDQYQGGR